MRICSICGQEKNDNDFYYKSNGKPHSSACIKCDNKRATDYKHSIDGFIANSYSKQKYFSKTRNHALPTYTKAQYSEWLLSQSLFYVLFNEWQEANFDSYKKPSIDRIDSNLGYSLENIRLVTWQDNFNQAIVDIKNGKGSAAWQQTPVSQFTKNGDFIKSYVSQNSAARETGIWQQNINKALLKKRKHAGGYVWKYAEKEVEL